MTFPFLDGFRGMLAVWVFIYHATYFSGGSLDRMPPGAAAVDLFMLVSGFLMSSNYHARAEIEPWDAPSTWLTFYTRRFFRIAPLYYFALAFAILLGNQYSILTDITVKAYPPPWASSLPLDPVHRDPSLVNALLHASFLFGFLPTFASNNVLPDWSLALEMQFYAVFPFLMLFMRRLGFLPTAALSMALFVGSKLLVSVYLAEPKLLGTFPQPTLLPLKLNCFLVGMLISEAYYSARASIIYGALATALGLAFFRQNTDFSVLSVLFMILVMRSRATKLPEILIRIVGPVDRVLSAATPRQIGDISYGIYLLHVLILLPIACWLTTQGWYSHQPPLVRTLVLSALAFIPVYLGSIAMHILIERPLIDLGRGLIRRPVKLRTAR